MIKQSFSNFKMFSNSRSFESSRDFARTDYAHALEHITTVRPLTFHQKLQQKTVNMSVFKDVDMAPPVAVFNLTARYKEDKDPAKVNLGVGAYRTDEGKPWVLPVVRTVESQMAADSTLDHEYLPIAGLKTFTEAATRLALGDDSPALLQNRAGGFQALSGTGALRLGIDFLSRFGKSKTVYVSDPTWPNHMAIGRDAHFTEIKKYRYWDDKTKALNIDGMLEDLRNAPEHSVVILHGCAHNPTGVDPKKEQWEQIAEVMAAKKLFPFFDIAYQGFATGDLDADASSVRLFVKKEFELFVSQSFSKNFGLYNERVGNLAIVTQDNDSLMRVQSQLEKLARPMWSNPPNHGARIVATTLNNPSLFAEWKEAIRTMSSRVISMRALLKQKLKQLNTPGSWDHITDQIGMFSYTGLTSKQVDFIIQKYHVYLMQDGRINMCAVTNSNCDHIAAAIHDAVTSC
ncbi:aspartate aminotransferase, cytoplasmic-like [Saccoglossus kowalevskii]|uniref:Aspartate aminotransferase n=1 Tax=Saccoglossus kowalevskii TaxID=10224 RepID=A0ABM0GKR8_SACKO|nr:PREDICTED: aspartate aminotransferase, cytoplasmic-like [Saccoglossus kowalevskii]